MDNPKISVILPIFNVEDYLEETLNSLLNQSMIEDIEVLMVDDGSTDNSRYIIENYSLDYDNFHAFHKDNEGQGIARNFALKKAKGEYIHFLDSDDYILFDAYETLYDLAIKNDSDIIIGNVLRFGDCNLWSDPLFKNSFSDINHDIKSTTLKQFPSLLWDTSTSNKLYKKEFLQKNNIKFPDKKIFFEDLIVSLEAYIKADSIYISNYIFYYWRYRSKKTSVTQQHKEIKNFYDRLEILELINKLMIDNNLSQDLINLEYKKWLDHDLKIFLKNLINYPNEYHQKLIYRVNEILNIIPNEFLKDLNSFKQIIYAMVKNNDIEGLLTFAEMENDLRRNPRIPDNLDEKYHKFIDFSMDSLDETLNVKINDFVANDDELIIKFSGKLGYADSNNYDASAYLVDLRDNEYKLKVIDNQIMIPFDLIEDKTDLKVKIIYNSNEIFKESYLKYYKRDSLNFNSLTIDFNSGVDNILVIGISKRNNNKIIVNTIDFDGDYFIFKFKSHEFVSKFSIMNLVTFDKINYLIDNSGDEYLLKIPYSDILNVPIKKWFLNCEDFPNSFESFKNRIFFKNSYKIVISVFKNKILIENSIFNNIEELENEFIRIQDLKNDINTLKRSNKKFIKSNKKFINSNNKLINKNQKLTDEVEAFKSRRLVKIVDRIKRILFFIRC